MRVRFPNRIRTVKAGTTTRQLRLQVTARLTLSLISMAGAARRTVAGGGSHRQAAWPPWPKRRAQTLAGPDALLYKGFHPMAQDSRMTPRSPEETALLRTALRRFPGGVMSGYHAPEALQFVIKEARGAHLYDFSGREYID